MFGSLVPAFLSRPDQRRHARGAMPTLKVRINGKSYRTKDWSLSGFRLDDFDGVCEWGEQIRGVILFRGRRGEVVAEAVRLRPGEAVWVAGADSSAGVFPPVSAHR